MKSTDSLKCEEQRTVDDDLLTLLRRERIEESNKTFWEFCRTLAPEFYKVDRPHLKILCDTLQAFYEGKLLKPDGTPYRKLMINMPPRHGKTRTLVMFCMWILGILVTNRIIACSYNDDMAFDFSRYTRDGISMCKTFPHEIDYSDIFPKTRIKPGNATFEKWALAGQFFNYKGAGIDGSITGKGGTVLIADDLVKDNKVAYDAKALKKIWGWYTGTFLSRKEEGAIEIIIGTPWAKDDPIGRIKRSEDASKWYILVMPAVDKETGEMLCPELLSRESYEDLRRNMDTAIFLANYHMEPLDVKGVLYPALKTYTTIERPPMFEQIRCYIDYADQGDDYLCVIVYGVFEGEAWILDVYYTKAGAEVTEGETAHMLIVNDVNVCAIESQSGGRGFARAVERLIWEKTKTKSVVINTFHQGKNKMSRILSWSNFIMNHVYFPWNWKLRWTDFHEVMTTFHREGTNEHDDAPDAITGVAENISLQTDTEEIKSLSSIGV